MPYTSPSVVLADQVPLAEAVAMSGSAGLASRMDHVHPRLTSATVVTLNAGNEATVVFTRTFPSKPSLAITYVEAADNQPIVIKVKSWTIVGSDYTGCVIKGYRATPVPQNLVSLLLGAVFNLFSGSSTSVEVTVIALMAS